ncbi:hypothetical protein CI102_13231 [Trichoderma harzianum]|uniref:Uncharacterized protein n=1 Tax=Trichoderma harzianum CBS 226.95 TaxID=983964 RepID=A0A2T4A7A7_TRIHA|nr:hypothetical protein M431DRAFT_475570 [Trichoderma harzianum CBS 226.95]PKK42458.1 hypothetical protein CI102_13231 [Trichoderma harzianum]PTB52937.1 hypothetical protein M431DRAFT_475570 [Trichoderma harzianum CBS 226.95]
MVLNMAALTGLLQPILPPVTEIMHPKLVYIWELWVEKEVHHRSWKATATATMTRIQIAPLYGLQGHLPSNLLKPNHCHHDATLTSVIIHANQSPVNDLAIYTLDNGSNFILFFLYSNKNVTNETNK